jgi:subtilase family serine protease
MRTVRNSVDGAAAAAVRCARVVAMAGAAAWLLSASVSAGSPQSPAASAAAAAADMVPLPGHVNRLAQPQFDVGEAPSSLAMGSLEIIFAKTAAQERALEQLLAAQHDPTSPLYHHWLTPAQYGARFGASNATVAALSQWLEANGFKVDALPANRAQLRFHGTKAQVEAAFHTQIHVFEVDGVRHFANVSAPQVPAALATQIMSIRGLHDFYPKPGIRTQPLSPASGHAQPQITFNGGKQNFVGPGDFAVIYNLLPLYNVGGNGNGVTIAVGAESDIDPSVASSYWTGFGLNTPSFNSIPVPNGTDPGQTMNSSEDEAYLDVEIAGGLAQGAKILLVRDTNVILAAEYVIQSNLAAILNLSFGQCESTLAPDNSAISSLFEEAVSQGITVTVSAGDSGVATCAKDFTQGTLSTSGFAVNGLASTAYDVAVGGTDFDPTRTGDWATSNAPTTLANAEAHIPEMVWNNTCANPLLAQSLGYSTSTLCNTTTINGQPNPYLLLAGGGGGLSSCLTLSNNACQAGYPQPSWQSGVNGLQGFANRAIPDVSLIADWWVICSYETSPCDPASGGLSGFQGTSAAAPSLAAVIAILDQGMATAANPDGRQGLINTQLYPLAAAEYGTPQAPNSSASSACSASLGANIGAACIFYNVTAGTNTMPCEASAYDQTGSVPSSTCGVSSGEANGVMEIDSTPQYQAGTGFSLATGLGSINAGNLVLAIYLPPPSGLAAKSSGQSVNLGWTAEAHATSFNVYQGSQAGKEGATPVQTGASGTSATVSGLQYGQTYYFTIAAESVIGASGQSNEAHATIVPAAPTGVSITAGNGSVTLSWSASSGATGYNIYQGTSSGAESTTPVQSGLTATTVTVTGLTNGTTYYYVVAAVDAGGISAASAQASATPTAPGGGGASTPLDVVLLALLVALGRLGRLRPLAAAARGESR